MYLTLERKHIKQILIELKRKIDSNTILEREFNSPLSPMDRSSRQKINEETEDMNKIID